MLYEIRFPNVNNKGTNLIETIFEDFQSIKKHRIVKKKNNNKTINMFIQTLDVEIPLYES